MSTESTAATSPAPTGDAKQGSGNLTQGQAAARLFANQTAETAPPTPPEAATVETTPEKSEQAPSAPVAEADTAPVETAAKEEASAETTPAQAESEVEDDSEVPSHSTSQFTPEQQKIFNHRLGKEIGKRSALEAKVAEMENRLAEYATKATTPAADSTPASIATPVASAPGNQLLTNINDLAGLGALQQQAKSAVRWAEETLDTPKAWKTRVETDPDTGEENSVRVTTIGDKAYTEAEVKGIMRTAKVTLEDQIPARASFITARDQAQRVAREEFPFLADKKSPEYQQAQQMLRDPWVQMRPDAEWIVGNQIVGMKAMAASKAAAKAATETKAKPKIPAAKPSGDQAAVSSTAAAVRAPVSSGNRQALMAEQEKLSKKGGITMAEASASLKLRERLRNSR